MMIGMLTPRQRFSGGDHLRGRATDQDDVGLLPHQRSHFVDDRNGTCVHPLHVENGETVGTGLGEFLYALDLVDKSCRGLRADGADRQLAALLLLQIVQQADEFVAVGRAK
jgi:hypothetical protein